MQRGSTSVLEPERHSTIRRRNGHLGGESGQPAGVIDPGRPTEPRLALRTGQGTIRELNRQLGHRPLRAPADPARSPAHQRRTWLAKKTRAGERRPHLDHPQRVGPEALIVSTGDQREVRRSGARARACRSANRCQERVKSSR